MDGSALDEVVGISRSHIDQVEGRAVWRYLNVEAPTATNTATQASSTAAVGIQGVNLKSRVSGGEVAASRRVGRGVDIRRDPCGIQREGVERCPKAATGLADDGH